MDAIEETTHKDGGTPTNEGPPAKPPLPPMVSNKSTRSGRTRSIVWDHFTRVELGIPNKPRDA